MELQQTKADITRGISQEQLKQQVTREHLIYWWASAIISNLPTLTTSTHQ